MPSGAPYTHAPPESVTPPFTVPLLEGHQTPHLVPDGDSALLSVPRGSLDQTLYSSGGNWQPTGQNWPISYMLLQINLKI